MSENNGQFPKGNTTGESTRFKLGNKIAEKYCEKYADMLVAYFQESPPEYVYKRSY